MNKLKKCWDDFCFGTIDPLPVSFFRISLGILLFIVFVSYYPNWERFYDADGIISLNDPNLTHHTTQLSIFYWTGDKIPVKVFWWIGFFSTIAFTIGWKTRIFTIVLYFLYSSMMLHNSFLVGGDDHVFRMLLFYGCFATLDSCLSIESLKKKVKKLPVAWPIRLMQINIALMYVTSTPYKLITDEAWLNGEALYWAITSNYWSRFPFPELFYMCDAVLSKIATYGTIFIESTFPILVWFKKTRVFALIMISFLHIGIAFIIPNVTIFTLSMLCSFWLFTTSDLIKKIVPKLIK